VHSVAAVLERGVDEVLEVRSGRPVGDGFVDVGKHLRPSWRGGRVVLYVDALVAADAPRWRALKLP
jgi:hypothetical protein